MHMCTVSRCFCPLLSIRDMDYIIRILPNFFWLFTEYFSRLLSSLVISAVIARGLGVEAYGLFQYAIGLVAVFSAFSFVCGAEVLVPKLVNADASQRKSLLGNAFLLRLVFSLVAYSLLVIFAWLTESGAAFQLISILGLSILLTEAFAVVTAWLQAITRSKSRSILANIVILLKGGAVYALFLLHIKDPRIYAVIWVIESIFMAFGLFFIYKNVNKSNFFSFEIGVWMGLLKEGVPFFMAALASYLFLRLDLIMLRALGDIRDVGLYASASQLFAVVTSFSGILVSSMASLLVYQHASLRLVRRNVIYMALVLVLIATVAAASMNFVASFVLISLFGEKFQQAIPLFNILVWGAVLYFLDAALTVYIVKIKRGGLLLMKWVFSIVFSFLVYQYYIPLMGAHGAVAGYLIGYAVACLVGIFCFLGFK